MPSPISSWPCVSWQTSVMFPVYGRGDWGLERSNALSPFSELMDAAHGSHSVLLDPVAVFSAYIVSSEKKVSFWSHTWVISNWRMAPSPYPMPLLIYCRNLWKEAGTSVVLTQQSYPLPSTYNFNLPSLQILLLHFTAKENGPAIQIPSYGSWLYYRPWDVHLLSIGLTFWDWDWKK